MNNTSVYCKNQYIIPQNRDFIEKVVRFAFKKLLKGVYPSGAPFAKVKFDLCNLKVKHRTSLFDLDSDLAKMQESGVSLTLLQLDRNNFYHRNSISRDKA